jgi:hypothetical protein
MNNKQKRLHSALLNYVNAPNNVKRNSLIRAINNVSNTVEPEKNTLNSVNKAVQTVATETANSNLNALRIRLEIPNLSRNSLGNVNIQNFIKYLNNSSYTSGKNLSTLLNNYKRSKNVSSAVSAPINSTGPIISGRFANQNIYKSGTNNNNKEYTKEGNYYYNRNGVRYKWNPLINL